VDYKNHLIITMFLSNASTVLSYLEARLLVKDFRELVWRVYDEARPYFENPDWLRELLEKFVLKAEQPDALKAWLRDHTASEEATKQTDVKIYIAYLERLMKMDDSNV